MPNPSLGELFTQTWQKIDQMKLHVCLSGEYNVTTLVPTVDYPEENTFYLVPDGTGNNVYTEWVYINNNWERFGQASIDLSNYVQKTDYATGSTAGLVKATSTLGLYVAPEDGTLNIAKATDEQVKTGTQIYKPITPVNQHMATFYGLAKAAGDSTQAASDNAVGTYTANAKLAINNMLGTTPISYVDGFIENEEGIKVYEFEDVESTSTTGSYVDFHGSIATSSSFSYTAPIQVYKGDVVYVTAQGYTTNVAMIAWAESSSASSFTPLAISDDSTAKEYSASIPEDGYITCSYKTSEEITITIKRKFSNDALDQRTEYIEEIMPNLMSFMTSADFNILTNQTTATIDQNGKYIDKNGNVQTSSGNMYTNAIALPANSTIIFGAQGYLTNVAVLAKDNGDSTYTPLVVSTDSNPYSFTYHTQNAINVVISTNKSTVPVYMIVSSKLDNAVLNTDYATSDRAGVIKIATSGTGLYCHPASGELSIARASATAIKNGTNQYSPIVPLNQHEAAFYGLATAAGDSTQKASDNTVGTYTNEAKAAIRDMLGVEDNFTRNSVNRIVSLGTIIIDGTEKTTTLNIRLLQEGTAQLVIGSNATTIHLTKSTADNKIYYTSTETLQDGVTPILTLYHDSSATDNTTVTYSVASDTTYNEQKVVEIYYPTYIVSTHGIGAFIISAKTGYATKLVSTDDIATDSIPGVVKVNAGHGIAMDSDGVLQLTTPTASQLQALSNGWLAPRLNTMHTATFYSLAKAAGDTTQSISNNAVGLYTDNAKTSIQKMIGTYEAPWELIRDDTFTNATMAEYIISTDDNNNSFELTDCYLWIIVPATDQTGDYGIGNFGRIRFLTDKANIYFDVMVSEVSNPTTSKVCGCWFTQQHGAIHLECTNLSDVGNTSPVRRFGTNNYDSQLAPLIIPLVYPRIITSVKIAAAQGTIKYRLYGRRKWQT